MQLSLFDAPFIGYNKAIDALLKLDCIEARKRLKHWQKSFPGQRDLYLEFGLTDFLCQNQTRHALDMAPILAFHLSDKHWEKVFIFLVQRLRHRVIVQGKPPLLK